MHGDESIMKHAAVDLNTVCCQGQYSKENVNLTEIQLNQHSVSLDSNVWPTITLALFTSSSTISLCLLHSFLQILFLAMLPDISPTVHAVSLGPRRVFLSPSRKIQYLSQSV